MDSCIRATACLLWVSILKCIITVVWVLVILGTLGSQRFSQILKEILDIISFMRVHCDWDDGRGHRQICVLLGNVFVQIPFPKHLITPTCRTWTPYEHIRIGFWRSCLFPPSCLPSTFIRWCQGPVWFRLLGQVTLVCKLRGFVHDWIFCWDFFGFGSKIVCFFWKKKIHTLRFSIV